MGLSEKDEQVIRNYQQDERMMILIFAQWCMNNELDPFTLYKRAYPNQTENEALNQAIELTVSREESDNIPNETLFSILSLFGNEDLAFIITEELSNRNES